jgi:hypothetical protein
MYIVYDSQFMIPNHWKNGKRIINRINIHYIGKIHTPELLKESGLTPRMGFTPHTEFNVYQIPVKHGVKMNFVTIEEVEAGVFYPNSAVDLYNRDKKKGCGCGGKCGGHSKSEHEVTESSATTTRLLGLCRTMIPCVHGCCQHSGSGCKCVPHQLCGPNCDAY